MNVLEKEIEDIVFGLLNNKSEAHKRGLDGLLYDNYERQLDLGQYGIADLVGWMNPTTELIGFQVIELKKEVINFQVLEQALRYCKGLEKHFGDDFQYFDFQIALIGKKIELQGSFSYLPDYFNNISLYTYSIDLSAGVKFIKHTNYQLPNRGKSSAISALRQRILTKVRPHIYHG